MPSVIPEGAQRLSGTVKPAGVYGGPGSPFHGGRDDSGIW
jgi:hypothetical protein